VAQLGTVPFIGVQTLRLSMASNLSTRRYLGSALSVIALAVEGRMQQVAQADATEVHAPNLRAACIELGNGVLKPGDTLVLHPDFGIEAVVDLYRDLAACILCARLEDLRYQHESDPAARERFERLTQTSSAVGGQAADDRPVIWGPVRDAEAMQIEVAVVRASGTTPQQEGAAMHIARYRRLGELASNLFGKASGNAEGPFLQGLAGDVRALLDVRKPIVDGDGVLPLILAACNARREENTEVNALFAQAVLRGCSSWQLDRRWPASHPRPVVSKSVKLSVTGEPRSWELIWRASCLLESLANDLETERCRLAPGPSRQRVALLKNAILVLFEQSKLSVGDSGRQLDGEGLRKVLGMVDLECRVGWQSVTLDGNRIEVEVDKHEGVDKTWIRDLRLRLRATPAPK
jgi:hypothetical protein